MTGDERVNADSQSFVSLWIFCPSHQLCVTYKHNSSHVLDKCKTSAEDGRPTSKQNNEIIRFLWKGVGKSSYCFIFSPVANKVQKAMQRIVCAHGGQVMLVPSTYNGL